MNEVERRVLTEVERCEASMISFLQAMVRQPSTLGHEMEAQQVVYRKLRSLGLAAEIWEPR